jgi:protein-S-isoprenylcysteine O-methyltransferase Ste14
MSSLFDRFAQRVQTPDVLEVVASLVIGLCVATIFFAVFLNFALRRGEQPVKREKRSVVATGSMTLFFLLFYGLIRFRVGVLPITNIFLRALMALMGLAVVVLGCWVNIAGRLQLGRNWANQVTIYEDQKLVTSGVYQHVRHPLYASLIWMFYGASLVYANWAAFLANSLVFAPFMIYRARQEEELLAKEFPDYDDYRRRVDMFFWKWKKEDPCDF